MVNRSHEAEEQSSAKLKKIYFFDLDHTLLKVNSSAAFGKYLFQKNQLPLSKALLLSLVYRLHRWGFVSLSKLHSLSFRYLFKGIEKQFISTLLKEQLQSEFDRFRSGRMSKIFEEARSSGELYILSASPDFIVEAYAQKFGADGFYATQYCTDEKGFFSHVGVVVNGEKKWAFAQEKIQGHMSFAYSDDAIDAPLLNGVTKGYLIEPER